LRKLRSNEKGSSFLTHSVFNAPLIEDQLNTLGLNCISSTALPAWGVFASVDQIARIDAFPKRAHECGFSKDIITFHELLIKFGSSLFQNMLLPTQCLNSLLPSKR